MYLCKPHFTFFFSFFFLPTGLLFRPRGQWQSRDIFSSPGRSPSQWHSFPGSFTRNKVSSNSNSMDCYFAADPLCKYKRKLRVYWDNGQCKDNLNVMLIKFFICLFGFGRKSVLWITCSKKKDIQPCWIFKFCHKGIC